jgi:two-component system OmpR family response regulator
LSCSKFAAITAPTVAPSPWIAGRAQVKILVAEDDAQSADFLKRGLSQEGHSVDVVSDGRDALSFCLYNNCDLMVLDRMLAGMDGLTVLKTLRAAGRQVPVLFLTSMGDVEDRVEGLMAGGDDYLVKPFHFSELLARATSIARRPPAGEMRTSLVVHDLELDLLAHSARRAGLPIDLQAKEFALLETLMRNAGRVVTKTMLLEQVWDFNFDPKTTVVETHVSRLRAKIDKPFDVPLIHTMRNSGYSLHAPR